MVTVVLHLGANTRVTIFLNTVVVGHFTGQNYHLFSRFR